jgi:membrane-associated phospholipid phosphatase
VRGERFQWRVVRELMTRPQPVTVPMVLLFAIIPFYLVIGEAVSGGPVHVPELAIDRAIPLVPAWSLVYASLFLAAILPAMVVHQQEHLDRTIRAFVWMWMIAFVCFFFYPTAASRPPQLAADGFADWGLRAIYSTDSRYNCLPSLHVAQCFLAAFTCWRVHRGVGGAACAWAVLVAISTLFTKQHYVLDALTGVLLAYAAYLIFIRAYPREAIPDRERRYAPALALLAAGVYAIILAILFVLYSTGAQP